LITHRTEFGELLGVFDEGDARLAVLSDVLALLGRVGGVDARGNRSRRDRADVGNEPLRAVEPDDRDVIAGFDAKRDERTRGESHLLTIFAPRGRFPTAVPPAVERRMFSARGGRAIEGVDDAGRHWTRR
jgi:hypothetical protein